MENYFVENNNGGGSFFVFADPFAPRPAPSLLAAKNKYLRCKIVSALCAAVKCLAFTYTHKVCFIRTN